jgi:hypothetical protein
MKRFVVAIVFASAVMAVGTIPTVTTVSSAPKVARFDDDPPAAKCPPLPEEFCTPDPPAR